MQAGIGSWILVKGGAERSGLTMRALKAGSDVPYCGSVAIALIVSPTLRFFRDAPNLPVASVLTVVRYSLREP